MEEFADESVNEISCMCSAQSAKTLTILCLLCWAIAEDPGPILWVTKSIQEARKLAKSRLLPLLERCGPVAAKLPRQRELKTTLEIYFPGAPLIIVGADSPASLQSTPYRYIFLDEVRSYKPGAVEMVEQRTTSYPHNYKKVIISTPSEEQDVVHRAFLSGDQQHWFAECINAQCRHLQELLWKDKGTKGGLKWDTNETTKPEGKYNFDELAKTIRYECEACGCHMKDEPAVRKHLASNGDWRAMNPNAPSNVKSHTWGQLLPWWTSWKKQVFQFLTATAALEWNDHEPLKGHMTETRGQPWADRLRYAKDEKFIEKREREYDPRATWLDENGNPVERRRFATIDVQGKGGRHFYLVIRAWGFGGRSRKLFSAKVWSMDELRQHLAEWKVPADNVAIDAGNWQSEVFQYVIDSGYRWKAMKGDDAPFFRVDGQNRIYTFTDYDPAIGTAMAGRVRPIKLWIFSKPATLDRLKLFQHGLAGDWIFYKGASEEYKIQVTASVRRERTDSKGVVRIEWISQREDHYEDCERMQITCAAVTELLSAPTQGLPLFGGQEQPNS